jgi:hypothetical protein
MTTPTFVLVTDYSCLNDRRECLALRTMIVAIVCYVKERN